MFQVLFFCKWMSWKCLLGQFGVSGISAGRCQRCYVCSAGEYSDFKGTDPNALGTGRAQFVTLPVTEGCSINWGDSLPWHFGETKPENLRRNSAKDDSCVSIA